MSLTFYGCKRMENILYEMLRSKAPRLQMMKALTTLQTQRILLNKFIVFHLFQFDFRWTNPRPIERFHTIPRDTNDNRHSGHVGVPNKRNNQNSFVKSTPTWLLWCQVKTLYSTKASNNQPIFFVTNLNIA